MKKININKLFKFCFLLLTILLTSYFVSINVLAADTNEAYLIVTNPGEDASSQVRISWHSDVEGTFVEYTKAANTTFVNATKVVGECVAEEFIDNYLATSSTTGEDLSTKMNSYRCSANLNDLESDTAYIYRIGKTTFSKTYSFYTAGEENFTFAFFSDVHAYPNGQGRVDAADLVLDKIEEKTKIKLIIGGGDMNAYGWKRDNYENLYEWDGINNYIYAPAIGNHEKYNSNAKQLDSSAFKLHNNLPENGTNDEAVNYFFKYNNVLFVCLDYETIRMSNYTGTPSSDERQAMLKKEKEWLVNVLENNPSQFTVFYSHYYFYCGQYSNDNSTFRDNFQPILDKYGVDLVLSGHDHIYYRTARMFNGVESTDSKRGAIYITNLCVGDRWTTATSGKTYSYVKKQIVSNSTEKMSLALAVSVDDKMMTVRAYDQNGTVQDSVAIQAKMYNFKMDDFLETVTMTTKEDDFSKVTLNFSDEIFAKSYKVEVQDENDNVLTSTRPLVNMTTLDVPGVLKTDTSRKLKAVFYFRDGSTSEKEFELKNENMSFGTISNVRVDGSTLKWDSALENNIVKNYILNINGKDNTVAITDNQYDLSSLNKYVVNNITFKAVDESGTVLFNQDLTYGSIPEPVEISFSETNKELNIGDTYTPTLIVNPAQELELVYTSSDSTIATVENGKVKAIKSGDVVITVAVKDREDVTTTISIKVLKKDPVLVVTETSLSIEEGNESSIHASVDQSEYTISYSSTDARVASVDSKGVVKAINAGNCKIIVKIEGKDITKEIDVTIKAKPVVVDPTPVDPEPSGGCNSGSILVMISLFGLAFTFFRRKRLF